MNSKLFNAIIFTTGAVIGAVVTWKLVKTKYERIADEEISSAYEKLRSIQEYTNVKDIGYVNNKPDISTFIKKYKGELEEETIEDEGGDEDMPKKIYYISEDDFGNGGYQMEGLTYYADGVLADDWGEPITDIECYVCKDFVSRFASNDSIYIRNDYLESDYEIVRDEMPFSTNIPNDPTFEYDIDISSLEVDDD